ncbi:hypothetical protein F469_01442 [Pseudomonas sp. URMO17WK12:I2]|nr:hypothetical protein F469_01442 [Pseudomonas sp. URMO17WK12:I2]
MTYQLQNYDYLCHGKRRKGVYTSIVSLVSS